MKIGIKILFLLLVSFSLKAQPRPQGLPSPFSNAWYRVGFLQSDSGIIFPTRDTSLRARFAGTSMLWQRPGVDTNLWINDGIRYFRYLKNGTDVINALGYAPLANITGYVQAGTNVTITGLGTIGSPYVISSIGGGSGNFNSFSFTNQNGITGVVTGPNGPNVSLALGTSLNGIINANGTGFGTVGIGAGLNYAGGILSATGSTALNGPIAGNGSTFITYNIGAGLSFSANTLTNTINNTNQLTNGAGFITNITGFVQAGTNVTITGIGTFASPYIINSTGSGGGISGAGNLSPLFTTSIVSSTLTFALSNANAHTHYGNFTGSAGPPSFGNPLLASADYANQGTTTTLLHGNAAGNPSWALVNLSNEVSNVLAIANGGNGTATPVINNGFGILRTGTWNNYTLTLDSANSFFHTTINLRNLGTVGDSLAYVIGGTTLGFRRLNFTGAGVSVAHNSDSSLTITIPGGGGTGGGYSIRDTVTCTACGFVVGDNISTTSAGAGYAKTDTTTNILFYGKVSQVFSANSFEVTTFGRMLWTSGLTTKVPIYATINGTSTAVSPTTVSIFIGQALSSTVYFVGGSIRPVNFTGSGGGGSSLLARVSITSGSSSTGAVNTLYTFNPASTLASYTFTLPASPTDQQVVEFESGGTLTSGTIITTLSVVPNSGQGIIQSSTPVTLTIGEGWGYRWNSTVSKWYRYSK